MSDEHRMIEIQLAKIVDAIRTVALTIAIGGFCLVVMLSALVLK